MIEVRGETAFERGVSYGEQAAGKIMAGINDYKNTFERAYGKSWNEIKKMALSSSGAIQKWDASLMEEVEGIACGAGVDVGAIMVLNSRYELTKMPKPQECTTGVVLPEATGQGTYLFKNWDYRSGILENIVILHIVDEDGTRTLGICEAGQLVRDGINSHGMGICSNNLQSVYDNGDMAIPSCFMRRKITKCRSFDEACMVLRTFERNVSCNTLLAGKDGKAIDFEVYPGGANELLPEQGVLTHANHFVVNDEIDALKHRPRNRDARLRELLMRHYGSIDLQHIISCLKDHQYFPLSICAHCGEDPKDPHYGYSKDRMTVASSVFDLANGTAHICAGNPCQGEYITYQL